MNKKRWFAVGLAIIIFAVSFIVPSYKPEEEDIGLILEKMLPYGPFKTGSSQIVESVIEQGSSGDKIAKIVLDGTITSAAPSALGATGYDHEFFMSQLDSIDKDPNIKGILFIVNSPGGGVYESAMIRDKILEIKSHKDIPIYVSMQQVAASGGYYVSAPADKIFATEETWTGSIGVIIQSMNFDGLFKKYGIGVNTIKSGASKDMGSPFREWNDSDREIFQNLVDNSYEKFVNVVAEGRNMDPKKVKKIADGRIYDGIQALENGLVDGIGYKEDVLEALKNDNDLNSASIIEYRNVKPPTFYDLIMTSKAKITGNLDPTLMQLQSILANHGNDTPRLMYLYGGE
ncbi:MAG: signal peptide peptidase SppA [Tissierellia bacterium]|nr:signal peptide peptidase SppA [Tissierellia bacterium]